MTSDWEEHDARLEKIFSFVDFDDALAFVNRVGAIAQEQGHHPDICLKDRTLVAAIDTIKL